MRCTNWWLPNSHRNIKYNTGNIADNIVINMCGERWVLEISGGNHFINYVNV